MRYLQDWRVWSAAAAAPLAVALAHVVFAKPMLRTPKDFPVLGELEPYLEKALGKNKDPDASLPTIAGDPEFKRLVAKHDLRLFGGPMVGSITDTGAKIWVRTSAAAEVQVIVNRAGVRKRPARVFQGRTRAERDFTAVVDLTGLAPFTPYDYDVHVNGRSALPGKNPVFRTAPAKGQKVKFHVGFGGGARYNHPKERIWDSIRSFDPIAFLFLGDNLYIDLPKKRNIQRFYYYRRQLRPEYRRLSASTALYAIWDDHDFGDNDCAGGPARFRPKWKLPVWRVFTENWVNPYYGGGEKQPGCWFHFSLGDVDFFMTDGRYYRDFKNGTMLGPVQKTWLLERLRASTGTFKVLCSGTLWTEHADKGGRDSWWGVKEEREEIFSLIDRAKIGGVILLSADRHRTDVYRIERPEGYPLYEFETSKLTNKHTHGTKKEAIFSYNKGNFFGLLSFDLTKEDPELTFRCITIDKKVVYTLTLKRSDMQAP